MTDVTVKLPTGAVPPVLPDDVAPTVTVTGVTLIVNEGGPGGGGAVDSVDGRTGVVTLSDLYQPLDSDLTAIAALTTTSFGRALLALADAAAGRTALGLGTAATQPSTAFDAAGAAAAAQAASQPLDSDLTAIAALTTTSFGRALLALADAAAGRTALGLGTAATQASSAFDAAGSAAAAQAAAIAASQPLDSDLTAIAALTTTGYGRALLELADAAAARTSLGLGTAATQSSGAFDVAGAAAAAQAASQPLDSDLTAIAALTTTSFGRGLLALADAPALRSSAGLGTAALSAVGDFQPIDSDLTAIAALTTTSFGRSLLALADAAALRSTAGLGNVDNTSDASKPISAATQTALDAKQPAYFVETVSTANITLSGTQTINGIAVGVGDRVLVAKQTTGADNGIYVVASGAWSRATDFDTAAEVVGARVTIKQGATYGGSHWRTDFRSTNTVGSTTMTWYPEDALDAAGLIGNATLPTRLRQSAAATTDWDTITASGFYVSDGAATHAPMSFTGEWVGIHIQTSNYTAQLVMRGSTTGGLATGIWVRHYDTDNTVWKPWFEQVGTGAGFFGDGSDGNVTISGTTTLTRDMFYDTLTVQNGGILDTAGFRVYCKTLCQVDSGGTIRRNGTNATSSSAVATANGSIGGGVSSGAGTTTVGGNASNSSNMFGGLGGVGGAGASGGGGFAGGVAPVAALGSARSLPQAAIGHLYGISTATTFLGGGAGGGGGGDSTNAGGAGGAGGGVVILDARAVVNNGTISANGGNGFTPVAGNCGGGGAGGGGVVIINTGSFSGTNPVANAGTPGNGIGTGAAGAAGSAGKALVNVWV